MKLTWFKAFGLAGVVSFAACGALGCYGNVAVGDDGRPSDGRGFGSGSSSSSGEPGVRGIPCRFLHGEATLTAYDGSNYSSSAFSFEFATQDPDITNNDYDIVYGPNVFRVNTVTDDVSFIVDLGDIPLADTPPTVELDEHRVGAYGEYDFIDAVLDHTYYVRSVDGTGSLVAAFRVVGLEPGERVTIEWIRSVEPDRMVVPSGCGL